MTTNLKSIAGTDFDDLFEAGTGNQLLKIYGMDGQDIGQKYLNVSQGSQVSANTGFQVSDSADVKTKLCGKGQVTISYAFYFGYNHDFYLTLSGIPTGKSVHVYGYAYGEYFEDGGENHDDVKFDYSKTIDTYFSSSLNGVQTRLCRVEHTSLIYEDFTHFSVTLEYGSKKVTVMPTKTKYRYDWSYKKTVSGSF